MNNQNIVIEGRTTCPLCQVSVNRKNIVKHVGLRCPKRPGYHPNEDKNKIAKRGFKQSNPKKRGTPIFRGMHPVYYAAAASGFIADPSGRQYARS